VDASCIWRWVQAYAPELNKRWPTASEADQQSYRIDENLYQCKRRGQIICIERWIPEGRRIDFSTHGQARYRAAKRFLRRAIDASGNPMPRVMNVDKNPAYPAAVEALKADGAIPAGSLYVSASISIT